jgi:hypothetical protein
MSKPTDRPDVRHLTERLGHKPLNRTWAKAEMLLGLTAAGAGHMLGVRAAVQPLAEVPWGFAAAGLALFVLGGYLALAGHRSHLYQSNNELTAFLADEIQSKGQGRSS